MPKGLYRLALLLSLMLLSSLARAETVLRLTELGADAGPEAAALHGFKSQVESATRGALRVDLHFADGKSNPSASVEDMMSGDLDLLSGDLRFYLPLMIDEISGLDLPFMVPNNVSARRYIASPLFNEGRDKVLNLRGVRFLAMEAFRGPHRMLASVRPIGGIGDLNGMKLAVFPGPTKSGIQLWSALGVTIVDLPATEVAEALRQHRLDGVISPNLATLMKYGVPDAAPYIGPARDHPQVWQLSINEALWQKLDAAQQAALSKAAADAASTYNAAMSRQFDTEWASLAVRTDRKLMLDAVAAHQRLDPSYDALISVGATTQRVKDTAGSVIANTSDRR